MKLTHFSTFTGIGGIDLAAEWAGFETVGQVEFADYPYQVLENRWPNVEKWRDVRNVTIDAIRNRGIQNITLLSGGFPCQPHSLAGKRRASNDERDLWGELARLIGEKCNMREEKLRITSTVEWTPEEIKAAEEEEGFTIKKHNLVDVRDGKYIYDALVEWN